jgi:hypothetical protein
MNRTLAVMPNHAIFSLIPPLVKREDNRAPSDRDMIWSETSRGTQIINATKGEDCIFTDDININFKTGAISANYKDVSKAIQAIKNFPSHKISLSVMLVESETNQVRKNTLEFNDMARAISPAALMRGWILADPMLGNENNTAENRKLNAKIQKLAPAVLDWDGREVVWDYMVRENWPAAAIDYDAKTIFQFDKNTVLINDAVPEWRASVRGIFNNLAKTVVREKFANPRGQDDADVFEKLNDLNNELGRYLKQTEHCMQQ